MNKYWLALIVFILVIILLNLRLVKTGYLIARVSPYEQLGASGSIYVLGDSTGYGTGSTKSNESVSGQIGRDFQGYSITNNSVNGRMISDVLERPPEMSVVHDLILIQLGANDLMQGHSLARVLNDVENLVEMLKPHTKQILMVTSGNIGAAPVFSGQKSEELEKVSREYAIEMNKFSEETADFIYVSFFEEAENDPFVKEPEIYFSVDNLHPTSTGYETWYQKIKPTLQTILN